MTLFDLVAKLSLDTGDYEKAVGQAKAEAEKLADDIKRSFAGASSGADEAAKGVKGIGDEAEKAAPKIKDGADAGGDFASKLGGLAGVLGLAVTGAGLAKMAFEGIAKAIKLAHDSYMEFESAFTGVLKTVDAPAEKLNDIKYAILELSTVIPATTTEISGVAEAAGQLGIAADDVMDFTEVMINLGNATNLSADEAATALARISNIMGVQSSQYSNLGSAIVGLGNNFATTEREIVDMATNMASTAAVIGLTTPEVLALSTAMSSLGIEAAAGGTSVSNMLKKIQQAVSDKGASLRKFAEAAGMTASAFADLWAESPMSAFQAFIDGLAEIKDNGGDVLQVLSDLDITDVRLSNTVLALAQGHEMLADAVNKSNEAWRENSALTEEAEKRYGTLESEEKKAQNAWKRMWTDIGEGWAPAAKSVAKGAGGLWKTIADGIEKSRQEREELDVLREWANEHRFVYKWAYEQTGSYDEAANMKEIEKVKDRIDNMRDRMTDKMGDFFEDNPIEVVVPVTPRITIDEKLESAGDQLYSQLMRELGYTGYKQNEEGDWEWFDDTGEWMEKVTNNASQMTDAFSRLNTGTKENVLSFEDMLGNLQANSEAMQNWGDNILDLNTRLGKFDGGDIILEQLRNMGVEGSQQVAELVNMTDEQLQQLAETAAQNAHIAFTVTMEIEGATEAEIALQDAIEGIQTQLDGYRKLFEGGLISEEQLNELTGGLEAQLKEMTDQAGITTAEVIRELDEAQQEASSRAEGFSAVGSEVISAMVAGLNDSSGLLNGAVIAVVQEALAAARANAGGSEYLQETEPAAGGSPSANPSTIGYPVINQTINAPKATPSETQDAAMQAAKDARFLEG